MSVVVADMKFRKSVAVSDTDANGGRKGDIEVLTGIRHNLFPRVTKGERTAGVTRYRKEFFCNENSANEPAYASLFFLEAPSNAGDRYYLATGTPTDTQVDIIDSPPVWTGVGPLAEEGNLNGLGGEYEVQALMEANDFEFPNGGTLHITNKVRIFQEIAADVSIGDSIQYDGVSSKWVKIGNTADIAYPKGLYLGSEKVMTLETSSYEDFLIIADNLYPEEVLATQAGASATVELATLTHNTNGICAQAGKEPVITMTSGGDTKTVTVTSDGTCVGDCTAGQLNLANGMWDVDITWTTVPDDQTDILCTYRELCYSYSGNTVTVQLNESVPHPYATGNTFVSGCVSGGDVIPEVQDTEIVSTNGEFNTTGAFPPELFNLGTIYDIITFTFTSSTNFSVSGLYAGSMGTGVTTADFVFTNPATSVEYILVPSGAWSGSWESGDTLTLTVNSASTGIWLKEVVPPGVSPESYNLLPLGWYVE